VQVRSFLPWERIPPNSNGPLLRKLFHDDISTGIKVIDMLSKGELILMFFFTTKQIVPGFSNDISAENVFLESMQY